MNGILVDLHTNKPKKKGEITLDENSQVKPRLIRSKTSQLVDSVKYLLPEIKSQDNPIRFKDGGMVQRFMSRYRRDYEAGKGYQIDLEEKKPKDKRQIKTNPIEERKKELLKMDSLIQQTDRVLIKVKTVFPFVLFPNTLYVDENKISYIDYEFFFTKYIRNILLANVAEVKVSTVPFFATLTITDMSFDKNQEIKIPFLWKQDAVNVEHAIQGIILARKEGIDLSKFSNEELRNKIKELGNIRGEPLV